MWTWLVAKVLLRRIKNSSHYLNFLKYHLTKIIQLRILPLGSSSSPLRQWVLRIIHLAKLIQTSALHHQRSWFLKRLRYLNSISSLPRWGKEPSRAMLTILTTLQTATMGHSLDSKLLRSFKHQVSLNPLERLVQMQDQMSCLAIL